MRALILSLTALSLAVVCLGQPAGVLTASIPRQIVPWSPADVSGVEFFTADNNVFQLTNATITSTQSNAAPVAYWNELLGSGNLKPLMQGTNTFIPKWYGADSFINVPHVQFKTNFLEGIVLTGFTAPFYFWVVVNWHGYYASNPAGIIWGNNDASAILFPDGASGNHLIYANATTSYTTNSIASNYCTLIIVSDVTGVGNRTIWMNGKQETNGLGGGAAFKGNVLGGWRPNVFNDSQFNGDIFEFGFVGSTLTTQIRTNIQNRSRFRYGITNAEMLSP